MANHYGIVISPSGEAQVLEPARGATFSLDEAQDVIGGYIEPLGAVGRISFFGDEEGRLKGLLPNIAATRLLSGISGRQSQLLVGNIFVVASYALTGLTETGRDYVLERLKDVIAAL